jgi:anaerobic ribonucleoside-triphosphate reductase activating protein
MLKYVDNSIVFEEIPDRVTLAFSISNCQNRCKGCHSAFLRKDVGEILDEKTIINKFANTILRCNCVLFLGEGNDIDSLIRISDYIKSEFGVETALYSGRDYVEDKIYKHFDFVKIGSYQEELGPLNKRTTNQKLFYKGKDITYKFWK